MKRMNLFNDVHDSICLLNWRPITPYHIYWHWCEYRKSINDDVIDRYNDMLIEAISIWEGGRVFPATMEEKLRHDVAVDTSRRINNYVPTQWQLRRDAVSEASWPLWSKPHSHFWWLKGRKWGSIERKNTCFVQSIYQESPWIGKTKRQETYWIPVYYIVFLFNYYYGNTWQFSAFFKELPYT